MFSLFHVNLRILSNMASYDVKFNILIRFTLRSLLFM